MTKKEALDALDHLIYMLDKRDNKFDFWVWYHRCEIELEVVFGKDSTQLYQYQHFGGIDDDLNTRISRHRALIEEFKGHVHRHGLPQEEVAYNPKTVTRAEFFDGMKQIPGGRLWSIWWPTLTGAVSFIIALLGITITMAYHYGTLNVNFTANEFRKDNIELITQNDTLINENRRWKRSYHLLERKAKTLPDSIRIQYGLP